MQNQIKRAIELSKKTGDRVIIVDKNNLEDAFVVMNLTEYEKIIMQNKQNYPEAKNLTENELLDRINRDIAVWKNKKGIEYWDEKNNLNSLENSLDKEIFDDLEDERLYYYNDEEEANLYEKYFSEKENALKPEKSDELSRKRKEKNNKDNPWQIPKQVKESAEEVLEEDFYKI